MTYRAARAATNNRYTVDVLTPQNPPLDASRIGVRALATEDTEAPNTMRGDTYRGSSGQTTCLCIYDTNTVMRYDGDEGNPISRVRRR